MLKQQTCQLHWILLHDMICNGNIWRQRTKKKQFLCFHQEPHSIEHHFVTLLAQSYGKWLCPPSFPGPRRSSKPCFLLGIQLGPKTWVWFPNIAEIIATYQKSNKLRTICWALLSIDWDAVKHNSWPAHYLPMFATWFVPLFSIPLGLVARWVLGKSVHDLHLLLVCLKAAQKTSENQ